MRTAKAGGPDASTLASSFGEASFSGATVTTKPDHRGERVISRKAIAQGMSDCLRCPVCSCAHLFVHIAHETAGAARIRHSLRPLFSRGAKITAKPRADRAARTPMHIHSLKIESPVSGGIRKACGPHSHSRN